MENFSWECPHCSRSTTITSNDMVRSRVYIDSKDKKSEINKFFGISVFVEIIICPNPKCHKHSVYIAEYNTTKTYNNHQRQYHITNDDEIKKIQLSPDTKCKNFPDYVPIAVQNDYKEAVLISDLSPKASATLSRRCLQGILRDYWGVKPQKLFNEINEVKDKIDSITWDAIDSTRKIGNIGAHMEKDIDLIIDVEPEEAKLLIHLIEVLIENWYIDSHEKKQRLMRIKTIADGKK